MDEPNAFSHAYSALAALPFGAANQSGSGLRFTDGPNIQHLKLYRCRCGYGSVSLKTHL